jgi:hypothetical protein
MTEVEESTHCDQQIGTNLVHEGLAYKNIASAICLDITNGLIETAQKNPGMFDSYTANQLLNQSIQLNPMFAPQDEYAIEMLSTCCTEVLQLSRSLPLFEHLQACASIYKVLSTSSEFSFLAKSPLARYYLANIYVGNKEPSFRSAGLKYVQANHVMQDLICRAQGVEASPQELAPWWDASMGKAPDSVDKSAESAQRRASVVSLTFNISPDALQRLGLVKAPRSQASSAVIGLQLETSEFLTANTEVLSVAYRLNEIMGPESNWPESAAQGAAPCDARNRCLPERSLVSVQDLQEKLKTVRRAAKLSPDLESRTAKIKSKIVSLDAQSKNQEDLADLVAYLVRHDKAITEANKELRSLHAQADLAVEVAQKFLQDAKREAALASLLAEDDAAAKPQKPKAAKKKAKPKTKQAVSPAASSSKTPTEPPEVVPSAHRLSLLERPSILSDTTGDGLLGTRYASELFSKVELLPKVADWKTSLNLFTAAQGPHSPTAVYASYSTILNSPDIGRSQPAQKRQVEGVSFWTQLPGDVLRELIVPFVDAGSFGRPDRVGTNQVQGVARSLDYHYNKHVAEKSHLWPLGDQTPVEDYLDTALYFGSRVERSIMRTNTSRPTDIVLKKYDDRYFGIFSADNKMISFGWKDWFRPN